MNPVLVKNDGVVFGFDNLVDAKGDRIEIFVPNKSLLSTQRESAVIGKAASGAGFGTRKLLESIEE